jgi:hypothetical protein
VEKLISDLMGIVREEIAVYRELVEHARRKTAILVQGRIEPILESNRIEAAFNLRLRTLENEMARVCAEVAQAFRIPREEFTLLKLAEGVEQSVAAEIRMQTGLFRTLVEQLKGVNRRNMRLVQSSIRYSQGLLDLLANATTSYQGSGLLKPIPAVQTTISRRA